MQVMGTSEKQSRVLVVDDNPTNVLLLARALQKNGFTVTTADNGVAAVEMAIREKPDLILLDVMMPDRDGIEVCRILKTQAETASIPIIFVTARSEPDEVIKALSIGGCDYITKPFIIGEVLARVSVHLRLRRTEQELLRRNQELEKLSAQLAELNVELARLSRTDPLTGLLNRRAWQESALLEYERSCRHGSPFGIAMIDVDYFKLFNDSQGHQAGDECLCRLAQAIASTCRSIDLAGRYGGEEFIILFPETDADGTRQAAERLRAAVWDLNIPHPSSRTADRITVSVGTADSHGGTWDMVVKEADDALYEAKRRGRNCVHAADFAPQAL